MNYQQIDNRSLFYSTMSSILGNTGVIFLSMGVECGDAGPVAALENQKAAVQTILTAVLLKQVPNSF